MVRVVGVLSIAVMAVACDDVRDLEEQCVVVGEMSNRVAECEAGLYCSLNTSRCTSLATLGEACNRECGWDNPCDRFCDDALGLFCGRSETCEGPHVDGEECASDSECAEGLLCNHGYLPDDPYLGQCRPPSDVGGPCFYAQHDGVPSRTGLGCGDALACVPPPVTRMQINAFPTGQICTSDLAEVGLCGYPGVCQPLFSGALGDGCLDLGGCPLNAVCNTLPRPTGLDYDGGFSCVGTDCGWNGPWPGLCAAADAPTAGESCADVECAPGFLCGGDGTCKPRWIGDLVYRCDDYGTGEMNDDFCELGRHCEPGNLFPICRPGESL